ncbi:helix-turn-helix domain-containing protein [Catenulispora pinisilvae]|uniref:helix-turn-helix domain-containing protein n=1 Tax=Catenulispora pinisilvae TaxID=2705253 RepID=UPI0018914A0C|nr:helix-turn-helix domain-containing protein [Catenulispora pinisilvae]
MSAGYDDPSGGPRRRYLLDVTIPGPMLAEADASGAGGSPGADGIPLPPCRPVGTDDYRARIAHSKVDDAIIEELFSDALAGGTGGAYDHHTDRIVLHVVLRGQWLFERPDQQSAAAGVAVPAGRFAMRNNDRSWRFEIGPRTTAKVFVLPAADLRPHIGSRVVTGAADAAEVRLLMAHARMIEATLDDLSPAGLQTARAALVELAKGVLARGVDGDEPLLAPALAQAAKDLVDDLLTRPDLAPAVLARNLNVSVRTLHRAFADTDESVTAYIRRRRLERARLDLATGGSPSVSEIAARWQFTDASHLARVFKARYGQTPTQFARSTRLSHAEADEHKDY